MVTQPGPKNPNWKGGRVVASNGYVLLKMNGHHLADVRGYVYEHRLIAEQKLGRRLRKSERPHHINGIKADNRPENIEVCKSEAHHRAAHRHVRQDLRNPDAPNPVIKCACGCGNRMRRYDKWNRPRLLIQGHQGAAKRKGVGNYG